MNIKARIRQLRKLSVQTGSLACLGCGYEHNCGIHGCAILRGAAEDLEQLDNFSESQLAKKLAQVREELEKVKAERDAAVKDLRRLRDCDTCLHNKPVGYDDKPCTCCMRGEKWQWRGLRKGE